MQLTPLMQALPSRRSRVNICNLSNHPILFSIFPLTAPDNLPRKNTKEKEKYTGCCSLQCLVETEKEERYLDDQAERLLEYGIWVEGGQNDHTSYFCRICTLLFLIINARHVYSFLQKPITSQNFLRLRRACMSSLCMLHAMPFARQLNRLDRKEKLLFSFSSLHSTQQYGQQSTGKRALSRKREC